MRDTELLERLTPVHSPHEIVAALPDGLYTDHYQPTYEDPDALRAAVHEAQSTEAVTNPRDVDLLQVRLTRLATGETDEPLIITGRCSENVDITQPIDTMVQQVVRELTIVKSGIGKAIHAHRGMGQNGKPRSSETETLSDGTVVESYYGDAVNSQDPEHRTPDPTRLVGARVQARDLSDGLEEATGKHIPSAHEALLMTYDMAGMYVDPVYNRRYSLSADMLWLGKRTNGLDGPHVAMLEGIENPIGAKIGADSTPEHIAGLQQRLNPDNVPGKLTFMLRIGRDEPEALERVVDAIAKRAPNSLVMYDLHATTRSIDGKKIRAVSDIIQDAAEVADALHAKGLKLHGVHLETIMDDDRMECVETPDQVPTHPGGVDPQLNPDQLHSVLVGVKPHLLRPTPQEIRERELSRHPLPKEVYERAGITKNPGGELSRTEATRRTTLYRQARNAILAERAAIIESERVSQAQAHKVGHAS